MATHLEMFTSEYGKRGREWISDGYNERYRRHGDKLQIFIDDDWLDCSMPLNDVIEHTVTWDDEPKTLTPQEALRALADGKCIGDGTNVYKMSDGESIKLWQPSTKNWCIDCPLLWHAFCIVPNPSQPAEPTKPPLKVGDRVKRAPGCECHLEEGDSPCRVHGENEEAEPQVEFPLTFAEAVQAAILGNIITWRDGNLRGALFRYVKGVFEASFDSGPRCFAPIEWTPTTGELTARWRIVEEGK